ncbi:MAG: O-methyltransferase [Phycisphaerae bacterium]
MINAKVMQAIDKLEAFQKDRDDSWNIPREEGLILHNIVLAGGCRLLVEVGTSYGFSGLFLGSAAQANGGRLHTFDLDPRKHEHAAKNFESAGLGDSIELHLGDARQRLAELPDGIDFAFLDATKTETAAYWDLLEGKLSERCIVTVDNVTTHPDELGGFLASLRERADFTCATVTVGNGFDLAVRIRK